MGGRDCTEKEGGGRGEKEDSEREEGRDKSEEGRDGR